MFSRSSKPHTPPPSNDPFDSPFDLSFSGPSSDPFAPSGSHDFGDFSGASFPSSKDDCFGSSPSPAFGSGGGSGGSPGGSGPSGNGRRPIWMLALLAAVLLIVVVLAALMGDTPAPAFVPQLDAGAISAEIEPLGNGQYRLKLRHELENLDPSQVYVAGYLMAPEGESLVAITEPDHILKSERFTAAAEIIITQPGNYQVAFYSYSLVNPIPVITKAQLIRLDAATAQTPLPEETIIIVVTPSPSPTPTPTPAPTPTPKRTASIPTPVPTPDLQLTPASDLFALYDVDTRYYYHLLTDVQKQAFSQMYDGIAAGKSRISLTPCAEADYLRALRTLEYDCPELFHWDHENGSTYYSNSQKQVVAFEPNRYAYDTAAYRTKLQQVLSGIRALSSLPGFRGDDFSRQQAIYDELIRRCTYNKELPYCAYADSIYLYGYAKCTGYARALNLALRFYGIPCAEVVGDTYDNGVLAPTSHMWSVARIDGAWYHCDATWDDIDTPFVRHAYLNLTDRLMFSSRIQDEIHDILPLPACTSTAANAIMMDGTYVRAGSDVRSILIREMAHAILSGGGYIQFCYESSADCSTTLMLLQDQNIMNEIYAKANKTQFRCTYYTCADVNYIGVNIYLK